MLRKRFLCRGLTIPIHLTVQPRIWEEAHQEELAWVEQRLRQELNVSPLVAKLLAQRGVTTFDEAYAFFRPSLAMLHDPYQLRDMERAVIRLQEAIREGESILVYGDYDVDGTTSVALVYSFLRDLGVATDYYIPDRQLEGYGISTQGVRYAAENGFRLVIALDCGIKAVEQMELATSLGVEFIICDHHLPGDVLPQTLAVIDPKRGDCHYPFKEFSGCGVGFKLLQAYALREGLPLESVYRYLDLVAVSTAADIVQMRGENRVLTHFGLERLNSSPSPGLAALRQKVGFPKEQPLTATDVVFKLAPRINAAGRMENGGGAVALLAARNGQEALLAVEHLDARNQQRQAADLQITREAISMVAAQPNPQLRKATVVYNPLWHKGVVGIVASRLVETYYKPTIVLTGNGMDVSGSARSVEGFNLYAAIEQCADLLNGFGGHRYAAGLTMPRANVEIFAQRFEEAVASTITEDQLCPKIHIDADVDLEELDDRFLRILAQFDPYGPDNPMPVFSIHGLQPDPYVRPLGQSGHHMRFVARQKPHGRAFPAVAFNLAEYAQAIRYKPFSICCTVESNYYRGVSTWQLNVKDIRI